MPNLDIVSEPIAEQLREAGWNHEWAVGDWYIGHDDGLPHLVKTDEDAMLLSIFGAERVHLPSRRALEKALEEMGYRWHMDCYPEEGKYYFRAQNFSLQQDNHVVEGRSKTPADAVALAYLEAKERQDATNS